MTADARYFPVQLPISQVGRQCMSAIPWAMVEPWRAQIERNHGQTLERLAERGGMSPVELWIAAHGRPVRDVWRKPAVISERDAIVWLLEESGMHSAAALARADKTAWLIEHADSAVASPLYFVSADRWTYAHGSATAFALRDEAVRIAGRHRVAEHVWCAPPEAMP